MVSECREFDARPEAVGEMLAFIDTMVARLPAKAAHDLRLASEEILVNIATYAFPEGSGRLVVMWDDDHESRTVRVRFEDAGIPFDPLRAPRPDLDIPIAERPVGGLGIMMVRTLMDDVRYAYTDGKNTLTVSTRY